MRKSRSRASTLLFLGLVLIPVVSAAGDPTIPIPLSAGPFIDELLPSHQGIAPEDFIGVLERTKLTDPTTEAELLDSMAALDTVTTAAEALALLPASVYQEQPDLVTFIETGNLPSFLPVVTGESIPATPAAGLALLPGFPGPYGFYASNLTNNWGMPNSPTGGCGPALIPGDGPYFDFRRACRQHDLGYRWTPVARGFVDSRFLHEMLYDCSLRGPVTRQLCAIQAGLYYAFTSILGGGSYGTPSPGYNLKGSPTVWEVPYSSCAQASHPWVYASGFGSRVPRTKFLYFTGVVRQHSRVRFQLIDAGGNVALQHMTHAARTNCVIHHEQERVPAAFLADGIYQVKAVFTPWETEEVTEQNLGNLEIFTPTGSTNCEQYSHAWVGGAQYPTVPGAVIYPNGVVRRNTSIHFIFMHRTNGTVYHHTTQPAHNNCVVHYQPEARSTAGWALGQYDIYATYTEWETDAIVTQPAGVLTLQAGGGGGGGGGGGCLANCP